MDINTFNIMYAETMMYYQIIEHDVKFIFAYMRKGDLNDNFNDIETTTLGQMIKRLEKLDYSDNKPLISRDDYKYLSKICDNRNHWAHSVFLEFVYKKNWFYSKEYQKQSKKLEEDRERVERAAKILEDIRIEYCRKVR